MHIDPFINDHPQIAFHQWRWLLPGQVVEPRHAQVADFQNIAKPLRGNQPRPGALEFEDGVRRHCGAVQHFLDVRPTQPGSLKHLINASDDGPRIVVHT